ncbi:hypothetical protein ACN47E_003502 [Coniothyrium glycines]
MAAFPPLSPAGLPASPRATRQILSPLTTSFPSTGSPLSPSPYSGSTEASSPQTLVEQRSHTRSSLIFINATIPLSPVSSTTSSFTKESPYDGLTPRKRSGLARLFSCFGREERARRRMQRATQFEKVGDATHWSEY